MDIVVRNAAAIGKREGNRRSYGGLFRALLCPRRVRFARDSPVEGDGFEPSVPRKETTLVGHPRSIPRNSPSAKETGSFAPGTDGSNPPPSSGESCANLTFADESAHVASSSRRSSSGETQEVKASADVLDASR